MLLWPLVVLLRGRIILLLHLRRQDVCLHLRTCGRYTELPNVGRVWVRDVWIEGIVQRYIYRRRAKARS